MSSQASRNPFKSLAMKRGSRILPDLRLTFVLLRSAKADCDVPRWLKFLHMNLIFLCACFAVQNAIYEPQVQRFLSKTVPRVRIPYSEKNHLNRSSQAARRS